MEQEWTKEKMQIVTTYYADNAKRLKKMVDKILHRFYELSDKDLDDFYSLANEVFLDVIRRYDESQSFEAFLFSCLSNKIKTEMTRRHREKRKADRLSVSIDTPIGDDENCILADIIPSDFEMENEAFGESYKERFSERMVSYLNRLSNTQRQVLFMMADGYLPQEIEKELQMSRKEYANCCAAIRSYENTSIVS